MTVTFDIIIILSAFFLVRVGVNFIKKLNLKPKWKSPLVYILGAGAGFLLLLLNRQGPFAKGVYIVLIVFFVYVAYLSQKHFPEIKT